MVCSGKACRKTGSGRVAGQGWSGEGAVAAGILPAVEGGVPPSGRNATPVGNALNFRTRTVRAPFHPPGETPGSTAGRMPAATSLRPSVSAAPLPLLRSRAEASFHRIILYIPHQPRVLLVIAHPVVEGFHLPKRFADAVQ